MKRNFARDTRLAVSALALLVGVNGCTRPDNTGPANAQGWTPGNQRFWYETSQGSRMMPLAWWTALEQPGGTAPLSDQAYLASFGYIKSADDRSAARGENLPVGFAVDRQADDKLIKTSLRWYEGQKGNSAKSAEPWVGLNCAACHSAEITFNGKAFRVDGGPGMGVFQSFVLSVHDALLQTRADPARFGRFAAKVLAGKDTPANRTLLEKALDAQIAWDAEAIRVNGDDPSKPGGVLRYGYARVDAFGHIYNKVSLYNGAAVQPGNPSDAPVSYPFLWDIHLQKRVQWNGVVENQSVKLGKGELDYGAMGRNAGEVIGVFGEVVVPANIGDKKLPSLKSSLQVEALDQLETVLRDLKPPKWPAEMGALDQAKVDAGELVFDRLKCGDCHLEREDWKAGEPIEVMTPLKDMGPNLTDIWMACNAVTYQTPAGNLTDAKLGIIKGDPLGSPALVFNQLSYTVKTALIGKGKDIVSRALEILLGFEQKPVIRAQDDDESFLDAKLRRGQNCVSGDGIPEKLQKYLAYKGRPLDGIWATAPYLHNGSVPTLYHLLQAPADRPKSFFIGSREYDPAKVGYVWQTAPAGPHSRFDTVGTDGKAILGNSNGGHDYGVSGLNETDRLALLEYLKSL